MKLLDKATVSEGDGTWTNGYEIGAFQCGIVAYVFDTCSPDSGVDVGGDEGGSPRPVRVTPFASVVRLNERPTFCEPEEAASHLTEVSRAERERSTGHALWYGSDAGPGPNDPEPNPRQGETWLGEDGVTSVSAGADDVASLGAALSAFYAKTVGVEPTVHLGVEAALRFTWVTEDRIQGLDADVVVNAGYDPDGIAVTGPIAVRFGTPELLSAVDRSNNRYSADVTTLGAIEFDPCAAVVVGPLPTHPNQS